ncbi:transcriptional regulator [Cryobacterium cheniae]|uniref:Transcriptional regulator n=1 Tax=Cryobacterium cheniae TaxID=1259262 RepID=A0A4R8XW28_9MICO|nr:transcriptional regulator GutM [Cryobacterium cheniae]TFC81687.1 transcriptional regulator [Cryobacterium cheniae]
MNFWPIVVALGVAYILQMGLAIIQMKSFTVTYGELRRKGKVAIGIKKGAFSSGAIVMHCVDDAGDILDSRRISGVTVFSKFRVLPGFEGKNIRSTSADDCRRQPKSVRKATETARENYITIMAGGTVAEPESPLGQLTTQIKSVFKKRKE